MKGFLEDPTYIEYVNIDKIVRNVDESKIILHHKDGVSKVTFKIADTGMLMLMWNFQLFIVANMFIQQANEKLLLEGKSELEDSNDFEDLVWDIFWFKIEREESESSDLFDFISKYQDDILNFLKEYGVPLVKDKLLTDDNIKTVIRVIYNILPTPVRLIVKEEAVSEFVIKYKEPIVNKLLG